MEYTSQYGQDKYIIENVFNKMKSGFFIEAGASDGIKLSNSFIMERIYGWDGICIEPHPESFEHLKHNRSCIVSDEVLDVESGDVDFYCVKNIDNNYASMFSSTIPPISHRYTTVRKSKYSLYELLQKYNVPKMVHYMSLDVEGNEFDILKQYFEDEYVNCVDDDCWRRIILTFSIEHNFNSEIRLKIKNLMEQFHYTRCRECEIDDIYVHNMYKDVIK